MFSTAYKGAGGRFLARLARHSGNFILLYIYFFVEDQVSLYYVLLFLNIIFIFTYILLFNWYILVMK